MDKEELQNALDEIKKNDKESNMIAMVAQTLFEKVEAMQHTIQDNETRLVEYESSRVRNHSRFNELQMALDEQRNEYEKMEMIKCDLDKQIQDMTERVERYKEKQAFFEEMNSQLKDENISKEEQI